MPKAKLSNSLILTISIYELFGREIVKGLPKLDFSDSVIETYEE